MHLDGGCGWVRYDFCSGGGVWLVFVLRNKISYLSDNKVSWLYSSFFLQKMDSSMNYNASECAGMLGAAGCGMIFAQGAGCGWFLYYKTQSHSKAIINILFYSCYFYKKRTLAWTILLLNAPGWWVWLGAVWFLFRGLGVVGFCTTNHNLIVKR